MTDLELKKMIGAALMVRPTDNWHYPLSENQLRHLIARAVEDEREAISQIILEWCICDANGEEIVSAIRARGQ